jgi:hypothetical protein
LEVHWVGNVRVLMLENRHLGDFLIFSPHRVGREGASLALPFSDLTYLEHHSIDGVVGKTTEISRM